MLINEDHFADSLFKFYKQQRGGTAAPYPVFRGSPYQWGGAGIGDILRSLARAGVPIAGNVVGDYIKAASSAFGEGKSIGESLMSGFRPAFGIGASKTLEAFKKKQAADTAAPAAANVAQTGTGRNRRRRREETDVGERLYKRAKYSRNAPIFLPTNF